MIWKDDFPKKLELAQEEGFYFIFCNFCFSLTMDHALSNLENFNCQGHNSLNFGSILKFV